MRRWLCVLTLILTTCAPEAPRAAERLPATGGPPVAAGMVAVPEEPPAPATEAPDPYEGWKTWCEPFDYDVPCQTEADCVGVPHPARRALKCINPWYARARGNPDLHVCAPGYHYKETKWHRARMREVIRQLYFGEAEHCKDDVPLAQQHWRCQEPTVKGDKLAAFLWVGYARETTGRPWKRHRLDSDAKANRTSWFKQAADYGWDVLAAKDGEVGGLVQRTDGSPVNPYYDERYRWNYGLGPVGQNAALWVQYWDVQAPPEVLCREVEPFEAYLRKANEVIVKLKQGIRCAGERYEDTTPTWTTLHRAVNMGSICPPSTDRHRRGIERFQRDAVGYGLNPDEVVTRSMLGKRMPVEGQNERAAEVYAVLESKLPGTRDSGPR